MTVTITCLVVESVAQLVDYGVYGLRIHSLDSSADGGVFGALGDGALAAAAIASCVVVQRVRVPRFTRVALPTMLAFLAVDKAARIHDHVPHWLVLYLPLLATTSVALVATASRLSARARRLIITGLVLLGGSFLVHQYGETVIGGLGAQPGGLAYQVKAVVKHGAELAGWLLCALGMAVGALDSPLRRSQIRASVRQRPSGVHSRLEGK